MNASPANRSKASRIRARIEAGKRVSDADRAWLARYPGDSRKRKPASAKRAERVAPAIKRARERAQPSSGAGEESRPREVSAEPARPPAISSEVTHAPLNEAASTPDPTTVPDPASTVASSAPAPEPYVRIDATPEQPSAPGATHAPNASGDPAVAAPRCPVGVDCPQCRGAATGGGLVCVSTGRKQYPRMTMQGARGIASAILFAIGQGIRLVRPDRRLIAATRDEIDAFAEALTEVAYRRASWASRWDDLSALAFVFGRYAWRAVEEPDQTPPRAVVEEAPKERAA